MDSLTPEELQKLQAAVDVELRQYRKLCEETHMKPLEAELDIPYVNSAEFVALIQNMAKSEDETKEQVRMLRSGLELERQARIEATEKATKDANQQQRIEHRRFIITVIISLLTLAAAVYPIIRPYLSLLWAIPFEK